MLGVCWRAMTTIVSNRPESNLPLRHLFRWVGFHLDSVVGPLEARWHRNGRWNETPPNRRGYRDENCIPCVDERRHALPSHGALSEFHPQGPTNLEEARICSDTPRSRHVRIACDFGVRFDTVTLAKEPRNVLKGSSWLSVTVFITLACVYGGIGRRHCWCFFRVKGEEDGGLLLHDTQVRRLIYAGEYYYPLRQRGFSRGLNEPSPQF